MPMYWFHPDDDPEQLITIDDSETKTGDRVFRLCAYHVCAGSLDFPVWEPFPKSYKYLARSDAGSIVLWHSILRSIERRKLTRRPVPPAKFHRPTTPEAAKDDVDDDQESSAD